LKQFLHRKSHLQWDLEFILIEGCSSSVLKKFLTVTTHYHTSAGAAGVAAADSRAGEGAKSWLVAAAEVAPLSM
jgi:hypothetical protein